MDPKGKNVLVTGGAHRVGKAIGLALAAAGANVAVNYNSSARAAQLTVGEMRDLGVEALAVQTDVSDPDQVQSMVDRIASSLGGVDILINGASRFEKTPFPTPDISGWHRVTGVTINGAFYCANAVAPGMLDRGEGLIVNMCDLAAWQPWPNFTAHSVGKAALLALTRQLALDLAPKVRVNAIAPGNILPPPGFSERQTQRLAHRSLLGRWGDVDDVVGAVMYLVQADFVTGEVLVVDGGERFGRNRPE